MFDYLSNENFHRCIASDIESGNSELIMQKLSTLNDSLLASLVNLHLVGNLQNLHEDRRNGDDWEFFKNENPNEQQQVILIF